MDFAKNRSAMLPQIFLSQIIFYSKFSFAFYSKICQMAVSMNRKQGGVSQSAIRKFPAPNGNFSRIF
jgi:hypothetical protein